MSRVPTNLIPTRVTQLPEYGGSDPAGYVPYVLEGRTYKVKFSNLSYLINFSDDLPLPRGTASAGVSTLASRGDHIHPAVDLADATQTTGQLPLASGGTGAGLSPLAGAVTYSNAGALALTGVGTIGQPLLSGGSGAPTFGILSVAFGGTGTTTSTGTGSVVLSASPTFTGTVAFEGSINVGPTLTTGSGVSTGAAAVEIGGNRTGDGLSHIDFHSVSGSDYEARILRAAGANGDFNLIQTGTGAFNLVTGGSTRLAVSAAGVVNVPTGGSLTGSGTFNWASTSGANQTLSTDTGTLNLGTGQTSGNILVGSTAGTGTISVGRSTATQTVNIAAGVTASGQTKTLNIGVSGASGSTTTITYGATFGTTHTFNGTVTLNTALGVPSGGTGLATLTANTIYKGNGTSAMAASNLSDDGTNITVAGTGKRFRADLSNASLASRFVFQSSTTNGGTYVTTLPNGTGTASGFSALNASSTTNFSYLNLLVDTSQATIDSSAVGSATALPMVFATSGTERMRIAANGNISFTTAGQRLQADWTSVPLGNRLWLQTTTTNGDTYVGAMPNGTGTISGFSTLDSSNTTNFNYMNMTVAPSGAGLITGAVGSATAVPLLLGAGGTERMRITTTGAVGIGTGAAVSYPFHARGAPDTTFSPNIVTALFDGSAAYDSGAAGAGIAFRAAFNTNSTADIAFISGIKENTAINDYGGALIFGTRTNGSGAGSTERMRIDSVGTVAIKGTTLWLQNANMLMQHDGTNGYLRTQNVGSVLFLGSAAGNNLGVNTAAVYPTVDNATHLGGAGNRFVAVWAVTGTIQTSDAREKEWRGGLSPEELAASAEIASEIGVYRWLDAIEKKGDDARLHTGVLAQTVGAIMASHGLDPHRYGFFCWDEWEESTQPSGPEGADVTVPAGERFGVRYDELAMFIAAGQQQRQDALEARITALEALL